MNIQEVKELKKWLIYVNRSSNSEGNKAGLILMGPNGHKIEYALQLQFPTTNNVTEYETLILSLE